ncbi:MAG: hypothetical protein ACHQQQ_08210 [Bacteroidota bacterium]
MANTNAHVEAEKWIREIELSRRYGQPFRARNLLLRSRGEFKFDAVSDDQKIVAVISTSAGITRKGSQATAKLQKIRSDVYWFFMLEHQPERRLLVFTEQTMIDLINGEKKKGRFPSDFEIVKVELPNDLAQKVLNSQLEASREVSPNK